LRPPRMSLNPMTETSTQPTEPGYYWARRDGDLRGEVIEIQTEDDLRKGECWTMGENYRESLNAFFLFYGPIENPVSVE
jgi:hypothetical protein